MRKPEKRKLERVQYWQGQMLRSRDFRDIETGEAQRRWWHNRAVHNAYGVAEGLTCSAVPPVVPTGVLVSPGVAYDIFGRELISEKSQVISFPAVPPGQNGTIHLLMRYKPPARTLRPDESHELCWTAPSCIATGTAEFVWQARGNPDPADGVVVCIADYSKGKIRVRDFHVRAFARPQARPLLASGTTIPGNTPWDPWNVGFFTDPNLRQIPNSLGVQTWIDTSAAGFTQAPCYFAWLQGPLWNSQMRLLTPAIFPSITDEAVKGFTFRLWLQVIPPQGIVIGAVPIAALSAPGAGFSFVTDPGNFALHARLQGLYVSWVGCQMQEEISCCGQQNSAATAAPGQRVVSSRNS